MTALTAKTSIQLDVMGMNRLLYHSHEDMVRDAAKVAGITLMGEWKSCVGSSNAEVCRFTVQQTTNERADEPLSRIFSDLTGAIKHPSVGGKHFVMSFVDDYSGVKWMKYLKTSNMVVALISFRANVTTPARYS